MANVSKNGVFFGLFIFFNAFWMLFDGHFGTPIRGCSSIPMSSVTLVDCEFGRTSPWPSHDGHLFFPILLISHMGCDPLTLTESGG